MNSTIFKLWLMISFVSFYTITMKAEEQMPVIAYMGVPNDKSTDDNFKTFADCGFNVSLYGYASLSQLVNACNIAQKYHVRILGHCPETHHSPEKAAAVLKNNKGFFGYVIKDEPKAHEIKVLQTEIIRLQSIDNSHCFYMNLYPCYAEWETSGTKTTTYPEYLQIATSTLCQQISFDFYPITTAGIRPTWYYNLEMIRNESLASGKPFWGFALSVPHDVPYTPNTYYPVPTLASLRLQIYVNLAYGAQAIQYFTYWNPRGEEGFNYHDAPISREGKKTNTYYLVQQMNRELKTVSKLFYGAKVTSVRHMKIIPQGCAKQNTIPVNLNSLKIVSSKGAIISQFEKNGHTYLAVVNKNHWDEMTLLIKAKNNIPKHITKSLSEESMKTSYQIPAGDVILFKLK